MAEGLAAGLLHSASLHCLGCTTDSTYTYYPRMYICREADVPETEERETVPCFFWRRRLSSFFVTLFIRLINFPHPSDKLAREAAL